MKTLDNKIAFVTAATQGIGLACVKKLAQNGATVYIGGIKDHYTEETLAQCPNLGTAHQKTQSFIFQKILQISRQNWTFAVMW